LLLRVFNGVVEAYKPKGTLSATTIKSYKKQGVLISLDDIDKFIQPPDIMSGYDTSSSSSQSMTVSYSSSGSPTPNTSPSVVRQLFSQSRSLIPTQPGAPSPYSESLDSNTPQAAAQPFSTIQPAGTNINFSRINGLGGVSSASPILGPQAAESISPISPVSSDVNFSGFSAGRRTRRKRRKQKTRRR
jgi:hypothetical protein